VDLGDDVDAVDDQRGALGHPQGDVEDRAIFRDVDVLTPEHLISALAEAGLVRQFDEEPKGLVGDALFGVIEVETLRLDAQALTTPRVVGEEGPQVRHEKGLPVGLERQPSASLTKGESGHGIVLGVRSWEKG